MLNIQSTSTPHGSSETRPLRVLNAYAGIGGNRHLWPDHWHVTAVEYDPRVAAEYARRYPADLVLVEDAHAVVLDRAAEFDAVWTSPPCPSHSRLALVNEKRYGIPLAPDPRLWAEVEHLRGLHSSSGIGYVVENVHTYYAPPISPDLVSTRHYYWASDVPLLLSPSSSGILSPRTSMRQFAAAYGLPELRHGAVADARGAMRNAVEPVEGLELALAAFATAGAVLA